MDDAKTTSGESGRSYKRLFLNTLTFAIGSFGSKLLVLILVPLYTSSLTPGEYGTVDLITQTANLNTDIHPHRLGGGASLRA